MVRVSPSAMGSGHPSLLVLTGTDAGGLLALLAERGLHAECVAALEEAIARIDQAYFDAAFVDVAGTNGAALAVLHAERPDLPLIALGDGADAAGALRAGAVEYLHLPIDVAALERALEAAFALERDGREKPAAAPAGASELLGDSPHMRAVREMIGRVASGTTTVFVRGETGTGKELVARAIHAGSARRNGPFIKVHAAALPEELLESELFGYEKGAFTGAVARKPGRVELAEGGTLFLDEIGEISLAMQAKLLRLIQDREYERLGGARTLKADVRFVAATHRDVKHMVENGAFREDLMYRLEVVTVWLPPLRARREDIPLIANHYLGQFRGSNRKPAIRLETRAVEHLKKQRWTGNVRELVNFVERMVVLAKGDVISLEDVQRELEEHETFTTQSVPADIEHVRAFTTGSPSSARAPAASGPRSGANLALSGQHAQPSAAGAAEVVRPLHEELHEAEHRALVKALSHAGGNRTLAARMLGISRRTLYTKLDEHGLT